MKRILVILSILMITGVSAQDFPTLGNVKPKGNGQPKIHNVSVNTKAMGGKYISIHWDVKNSRSSWFKIKGISTEWIPAKTPPPGNTTYGIAYRPNNDRTYKIRTTETPIEDKIKVRVMKIINAKDVDGNLEIEVHGVLNHKMIGEKVYLETSPGFRIVSITSSDDKSIIQLSKPNRTNIAEYLAILINRPGSKVNYIWFKQKI